MIRSSSSQAAAEHGSTPATLGPAAGSLLPFGVTSRPHGDSDAACLLAPPPGVLVLRLCPGPDHGNFTRFAHYRPTDHLCEVGDRPEVMTESLARGLDHLLAAYPVPDPNTLYPHVPAPDSILETPTWCTTSPDVRPNALETDTGSALPASVFHDGLLRASAVGDGGKGRLTSYPGGPEHPMDAAPTHVAWPASDHVIGGVTYEALDNAGLWEFIGTDGETFGGTWVDPLNIDFHNPDDPDSLDPTHPAASSGLNDSSKNWTLHGSTLPGICDPHESIYQETFMVSTTELATRLWSWNAVRMTHCLYAIDQSGATAIVFDKKTIDPTPVALGGRYDIEFSPRFGWVPESWRELDSYLTGGSKPWEIKRFRPVFLNDLVYATDSSNHCVFRAGQSRLDLGGCGAGVTLQTMAALLFDVDYFDSQGTMLPPSITYERDSMAPAHVVVEVPASVMAGETALVMVEVQAAGEEPLTGVVLDVEVSDQLLLASATVSSLAGTCSTGMWEGLGQITCAFDEPLTVETPAEIALVFEVQPAFGQVLDAAAITVAASAPADGAAAIAQEVEAGHGVLDITYPDPSVPDVPVGHLFEQEIWWGLWDGVTLGFVDGTFRPWDAVTRQAFVGWLWRLAGSPVLACPVEFSDVPEGHGLRDAICWAAATGVTTGFADGSFGPALRLTRGQAMAFLFRSSAHVGSLDAA